MNLLEKLNDSKGYIFDLDGTLALSQKFHFFAYEEVLKKYGIHYSYEEDQEIYAGQGSNVIIPTLFKLRGIKVSQKTIDDVVRKKRELYDKLIEEAHIDEVPGIREFLKTAEDEKKEIIIATGNRLSIAEKILKKIGIQDHFASIITNSDVDKPKPAPDIFIFAANKLGLPPEQCIIFEDSINGIKGAKAFNFFCIGLATSSSKKMLKQAGADIIIKDYFDLIKNANYFYKSKTSENFQSHSKASKISG